MQIRLIHRLHRFSQITVDTGVGDVRGSEGWGFWHGLEARVKGGVTRRSLLTCKCRLEVEGLHHNIGRGESIAIHPHPNPLGGSRSFPSLLPKGEGARGSREVTVINEGRLYRGRCRRRRFRRGLWRWVCRGRGRLGIRISGRLKTSGRRWPGGSRRT
jgi:hypothetical protein